MTIFSEVEEHLACSCQDRNVNLNYNSHQNNKFFNSEQQNIDEVNIKNVKGEKISSKPSKGRTRRSSSALNIDDPFGDLNTKGMYEEDVSMQFNINEEELKPNIKESKEWISDFKKVGSNNNFPGGKKGHFERYLPKSDILRNSNNAIGINKQYTSSSVRNEGENEVFDSESGNTTRDDNSVSIYYDTCLACKEQQDHCEESFKSLEFYFQR